MKHQAQVGLPADRGIIADLAICHSFNIWQEAQAIVDAETPVEAMVEWTVEQWRDYWVSVRQVYLCRGGLLVHTLSWEEQVHYYSEGCELNRGIGHA